MNNTIHIKQTSKKPSKFQKLWHKAERARARNARFREDLESVVQRVRSAIHPVEQEAAAADKPLLQKLLTLAQRKSLAQWQRAELDDWIQELVYEMHAYGLVDKELLNDMARYDAFRLGITLEDDEIAPPAEQLVEIIKRERALYEAAEQERRERDLENESDAGSDDLDFDDLEFDGFDFGADFNEWDEEPESGPASPNAPAVTNEVVQRLFRSTAAKLHPDREPDAERRKLKQGLMADLLRARKQGDVMRILELHQEYVGESQEFSKVDEQQLIHALEYNIRELENEKDEIIEQSSIHEMVYDRFYSTSKKKVDKTIAEYLASVAQDKKNIERMVETIRSLKTLKPYLERRYDARHEMTGIDQFYELFR